MEKHLEAKASRWYPHQFRKPLNAFLSTRGTRSLLRETLKRIC